MKSFPNIDKSGFHRGQYVGYGGGRTWKTKKSTSSFGSWLATNQNDTSDHFYSWSLGSMSGTLTTLTELMQITKPKN